MRETVSEASTIRHEAPRPPQPPIPHEPTSLASLDRREDFRAPIEAYAAPVLAVIDESTSDQGRGRRHPRPFPQALAERAISAYQEQLSLRERDYVREVMGLDLYA